MFATRHGAVDPARLSCVWIKFLNVGENALFEPVGDTW